MRLGLPSDYSGSLTKNLYVFLIFFKCVKINHLTPNGHYMGRTAHGSVGGITEKIPSDTTGNRSRDLPTSSAALIQAPVYTGCPRTNGQNFGRVFLMLNYTDITQNTYIQS